MMNNFFKAVGISVLAVGVLGACSEQSVEKAETSDEVKEKMGDDSSSTKKTSEKKETKAQVGETLNIDGINITITSIEPFTGEINEFEPLKQDHAVKVGVIVENTTKESYFVDNTEFKLYDKDGFELTDALPSDEDGLSSDIPAGKKVQGALFFDVPAQSGTWEVHYESIASFDGEPAVWEVPAK